ncbi:potassium channel family protein [Brachybacterium sp. YJGR34]|uniref:potassium channel family protein n=1 Tax=Brachybacterium sp. YJGR34 TaxID=2059911 RepID=UPI000E0C15EB|nr:potassium channel family protein [Brachybacterium sp. YJGR34]
MVRRRRRERTELKSTAYEIFLGALSILSIVNLVLLVAIPSDGALQLVLAVMNALFSVVFLGDFVYRITTASSASRYLLRQYGWADLLASLPFPQLKVLRVFRLLRVVRLLRHLGARRVWNALVRDRANSALMTLLLLGVLVLQFGSLAILTVEGGAEGSNITSASDALWYTLVTISTVGYGDHYPVTTAGRLVGVLVIVVGVGIFGTFTGYLANVFLGPAKNAEEGAGAPELEGQDASDTAVGVAAGGTSGAITAGAADTPAEDDLREQLAALIAQSERTTEQLRALLASTPGPDDRRP